LSFDPKNLRGPIEVPGPSPNWPRTEAPSPFADLSKPLESAEEPTDEASTSATPPLAAIPSEQAVPEPKKPGHAKSAALRIGG
jgi:hypothetical protein